MNDRINIFFYAEWRIGSKIDLHNHTKTIFFILSMEIEKIDSVDAFEIRYKD